MPNIVRFCSEGQGLCALARGPCLLTGVKGTRVVTVTGNSCLTAAQLLAVLVVSSAGSSSSYVVVEYLTKLIEFG